MRTLFFITLLITASLSAHDNLKSLKHYIESSSLEELKQALATSNPAVADQLELIKLAQLIAQRNENNSILSYSSKKSFFATIATFSFLGAFLPLEPLKYGYLPRHFHKRAIASLILFVLSYFAGSECLNGYYLSHSKYIFDYLRTTFVPSSLICSGPCYLCHDKQCIQLDKNQNHDFYFQK